ncbi:uncharacterized protein LOC141915344 [Tubulanus polymorphus]|uniref:uncharacterized protein LOC141915344 n=1 Tax=Tubulanus polymorphus TaxID=672921 RepID=UPI003DA40CE2
MSSYSRSRGRDDRERSSDQNGMENIDVDEGLRITIPNDRSSSSSSSTARSRRDRRSPSDNRYSSREDRERSRRSPDRRGSNRRPIEERLGPSPNRHDRDSRRGDYYRDRDRSSDTNRINRDRDNRDYNRDYHQQSPQKITSRWDDDLSTVPSEIDTSVIEGIAPENTALAQLLGPVLSTLASAKRPALPVDSPQAQSSANPGKPLKSILKSKRLDGDESSNGSTSPSFQSSFQPVAVTAAAAANFNPEAVLTNINASHTPFSMSQTNMLQPQPTRTSLFPIVRDSPPSQNKLPVLDDQQKSRTLPGLSVYSDDIDDEEMFLYGGPGLAKSKQPVPVSTYNSSNVPFESGSSRFFEDSDSNSGSMNRTAFPPGTNPSSSFPPTTMYQMQQPPVPKQEVPKQEEKPHDPTIENILKSIGFNFDLSKKIQDMKNKERIKKEKKETPPTYGINQMASFLTGGLSKTEIDSAFPKKEEDESEALKNEQLAMVNNLIRDAKLNVMASKREYKTSYSRSRSSSEEDSSPSPQRREQYTSSHQRFERSSSEQDRSQSRSPVRKRDHSSSERKIRRHSGTYGDSRRESRSSSRDRHSESRQRESRHSESRHSENRHSESGHSERHSKSRYSTNRHSENRPTDHHRSGSRRHSRSRSKSVEKPQFPDVGQQPFPGYGFPPYEGVPGPGFNPFLPPPGFIPPPGYQGPPPPPPFPFLGGPFPFSYGPPTTEYKPSEYKPYYGAPPTAVTSYPPTSKESSEVPDMTLSSANLRVLTENSSKKTDTEMRQEREEKLKALSQKAKEEIAAEMLRKLPISNRSSSNRRVIPPKQEPRQSSPSPPPSEIRTVKAVPIPLLSNEDRKKLEREREEREKRLKALEKQLDKLRKQQNEMMRKKARQRGGDKDPLFAENSKLQEDIAAQISALRKAAEDNARGFLNKSADGNWMPSGTGSQNEEDEEEPSEEVHSNFVYFDGGNYWCRQCNSIHKTIFDFFQHLHSKGHVQGMDKYNVPWLPESLKNPKVEPMKDVQMLPMRGVEFLMPCSAFYCSLCDEFSGDAACAEDHIKQKSHNEKYLEFLTKQPFYERTLNLDKWAALGQQQQIDDVPVDQKQVYVSTKKNCKDSKPMRQLEESPARKSKDERFEQPMEKTRRKYDDERRGRNKDYRGDSEDRYKERERSSSRVKDEPKNDDNNKETSKGLKLSMKLHSAAKEIQGRKDEIHRAFNLEEDDQDEDAAKEEEKEIRTVSIKPKTGVKLGKGPLEELRDKTHTSGFRPLVVPKKMEKPASLSRAKKEVKEKIISTSKSSSQKPMPAFVGKHLSMSLKRKTRADIEAERKRLKEETENKIQFGPAPKPEGTDDETQTITVTAKMTYDMFGESDVPESAKEETEVRTIRIDKKPEEPKKKEFMTETSSTKPKEPKKKESTTETLSVQSSSTGLDSSHDDDKQIPYSYFTLRPTKPVREKKKKAAEIPLPVISGNLIQMSCTDTSGSGVVTTAAVSVYSGQQQNYSTSNTIASSGYHVTSTYNQTPVNTTSVTPLQYTSSDLSATQAALAFSASQYATGGTQYPTQQYGTYKNNNYSTPNFPPPPPFPMPPFPPNFSQAPAQFQPYQQQNYQGGYNNYQGSMPYGQPAPRGPIRLHGPHHTGTDYSHVQKHRMKFQGSQRFNKPVALIQKNATPQKTNSNIVTINTTEVEEEGTPDEDLLPPGVEEDTSSYMSRSKPVKPVKPGKIALKLRPKNAQPCQDISVKTSASDYQLKSLAPVLSEKLTDSSSQFNTKEEKMEIESSGREEEPRIPGVD